MELVLGNPDNFLPNASSSLSDVEPTTVKAQSGVRTRIDLMGRDANGNIVCTECKASATAPLTRNQATAFPEIQQSGAVVLGKGKPGFPGSTQILPTTST